jgi:ketosteroid isomerase-like protein
MVERIIQASDRIARRDEMKTYFRASILLSGLLIGLVPLLGFAASPDEAAVLQVSQEWQKAWDSDDFQKLDQLLTDEIDMESRSLKATFKEKKSFLEAVKKMKTDPRARMYTYVTTVTDAKVKVSGDQASVIRTWYTERTGGGSRPWKSDPTSKEMRLRKQSNGDWRIYYEKYP